LPGLGVEQLGYFIDCRREIEGDRFDHQFARFDFREIENVIDDREQSLGGMAQSLSKFTLLRVEMRFQEKVRYANDAVHGSANLVAQSGVGGAHGDQHGEHNEAGVVVVGQDGRADFRWHHEVRQCPVQAEIQRVE
jgi:hypothetical protein